MKSLASFLLAIGLATTFPLRAPAAVLTFEDFLILPENGWLTLAEATEINYGVENRLRYGDVVWDSFVLGSEGFAAYSQDASDRWACDGMGPFVHAHSGQWALFTKGDGQGFSTDQILTGAWFARPTLETDPGGATQVTVVAWTGTNPVASVSLDLVDTTPVFMDTSRFLLLRGITRYTIHRVANPANCSDDGGYYIADDFQFASRSLSDLCPGGQGSSRGQSVRCLRRAVTALVEEGALTPLQAKNLLRATISR